MSLLNGIAAAGNMASGFAGDMLGAEMRRQMMPLLQTRDDPTPVMVMSRAAPEKLNPTVAALIKAFTGQESGGRQYDAAGNVLTSVTGAKGVGQIQPGTFAQYARPGEDINNETDNRAVMTRILADLLHRSGGDPARVAVGYFSGPGNIAPPDSPTPWKRDASDPNGKSVSSYVSDILRRLGTA